MRIEIDTLPKMRTIKQVAYQSWKLCDRYVGQKKTKKKPYKEILNVDEIKFM